MCRYFQPAPLFYVEWFLEAVDELPVEIVAGYREQDFASSARPNQLINNIVTSEMHMRRNGQQLLVLFERVAARYFVVRSARRDAEEKVTQVHASQYLFRRTGGKIEAHTGAVRLL